MLPKLTKKESCQKTKYFCPTILSYLVFMLLKCHFASRSAPDGVERQKSLASNSTMAPSASWHRIWLPEWQRWGHFKGPKPIRRIMMDRLLHDSPTQETSWVNLVSKFGCIFLAKLDCESTYRRSVISWPLAFWAVAAKMEAMPCSVVLLRRCMPWTFICFHMSSYMAFPAYLGEKWQMTKFIMNSIHQRTCSTEMPVEGHPEERCQCLQWHGTSNQARSSLVNASQKHNAKRMSMLFLAASQIFVFSGCGPPSCATKSCTWRETNIKTTCFCSFFNCAWHSGQQLPSSTNCFHMDLRNYSIPCAMWIPVICWHGLVNVDISMASHGLFSGR